MDTHHPAYKDIVKKAAAWEEIAKQSIKQVLSLDILDWIRVCK